MPVRTHDDQVLATVIVDVGEKRAGRVFDDPDFGCLLDVFERSVSSIAIKTIRQTGRLAHINIIETVIVDVAYRNTIVTVDINAASAIQNRSPIISSAKLGRVGGIAAECMRSDVNENRSG